MQPPGCKSRSFHQFLTIPYRGDRNLFTTFEKTLKIFCMNTNFSPQKVKAVL